jgi:hypothetical protein
MPSLYYPGGKRSQATTSVITYVLLGRSRVSLILVQPNPDSVDLALTRLCIFWGVYTSMDLVWSLF